MKKLSFLLPIILLVLHAGAQDKTKEVSTKVTEATVYINGAFLKHEGSTKLNSGKTILKLTGISPYFDQKSIRVSGEGEFTILGVNAQLSVDETQVNQQDTFRFGEKIKELTMLNEEANIRLQILNEKENFLQTNKVISSAQEPGEAGDIVELAEYYNEQITKLRLEKLRIDREVRERNAEIQSLRQQQSYYRPEPKVPKGEVLVTVSAKKNVNAKIELRYFTENANWFPSYDIRVDEVGKPVQLVYKASVRQQTGTEWKDVKLRFSNAKPNESGLMPTLLPYYLDYNYPVTYNQQGTFQNSNIRQVTGKVYDASTGEALFGATILVEGTSVGTVADMDGNFSLSIPTGGNRLIINYIGYQQQTININKGYFNIAMASSQALLDAVVVNAEYKRVSAQHIQRLPGVVVSKAPGWFSGGDKGYTPVPVQVQGSKSVQFEMEIDIPYSISKDGKPITIDLKYLEIPAFYEYQVTPKLDPSAYLFAGLVDWEQYHLLDGEANVYFENTFVGKTVLSPTQLLDTMLISLGKDQSILIERTKVTDRVRRQLIGKDRIESLAYETSIRNTKAQEIRIKVFEQYPLARYKEIEIDLTESSGGKVDEKTGAITWDIRIPARSTEKRLMEYTVKYPKEQRVYLY